MEDLMEGSGGFDFIGFAPCLAERDAGLKPVVPAGGHLDPARFTLQ
jgi:hypothetical protein